MNYGTSSSARSLFQPFFFLRTADDTRKATMTTRKATTTPERSTQVTHHHESVRDDDVVLETRPRTVVHRPEHALPESRRPVVHVGTRFSVHEPEPKPAVRFPYLLRARRFRRNLSCSIHTQAITAERARNEETREATDS